MDSYEKLINKVKKDGTQQSNTGSKTVKKAIHSSEWRFMFSVITVLLLIVPTCYMLTYVYYAIGTKSTTLMDVTSKTLYLTEPNTTLEELDFDMSFSLFSMNLSFEQYKQIGDEFYPAKFYELDFVLDDLVAKETNSKLDNIYAKNPTQTNQLLAHPTQQVEFESNEEWQVLSGLPDETVIEAYISLSDLYEVEEVIREMEDIDVTWAAIYTGVEDESLSNEGNVISPIGYPVQPDETYWSPFRESISHEETFFNMLKEIQPYEELAENVSSHKNLALEERIDYLDQHGFQTYGVVVTGPKTHIQALQNAELVKHMKLGEVKLWNWTR